MPRTHFISLKHIIKRRKLSKKELHEALFLILTLGAWKKVSDQVQPAFTAFLETELKWTELETLIEKNQGENPKIDFLKNFIKLYKPESYNRYFDIIIRYVVETDIQDLDSLFYEQMIEIFDNQLKKNSFKIFSILSELTGIKEKSNVYIPLIQDFYDLENLPINKIILEQTDPLILFLGSIYKILSQGNFLLNNSDPLLINSNDITSSYDTGFLYHTSPLRCKIPEMTLGLYADFNPNQFVQYGETLYWRVLLEKSNNVAICSPLGPFYRSGHEEKYRKFLIDQNLIQAIILIDLQLLKLKNNKQQIILLGKNKNNSNVLFIDGTSKHTQDNLGDVIKNFENYKKICHTATIPEIQQNNYNLLVERYVLKEEKRIIKDTLLNIETIPLNKICTIIRSQLIQKETEPSKYSECIDVQEIRALFFSLFGFTDPTIISEQSTYKVNNLENAYRIEKYSVRPLDIIITTKGSVGATTILSPKFKKNKTVIAAQTTHIIRLNNNIPDKNNYAIALYMFLQSKAGNFILKNITIGGTTNLIKTKDLENLSIPKFTEKNLADAKTRFKTVNKKYEEIQSIKEEIQIIISGLN